MKSNIHLFFAVISILGILACTHQEDSKGFILEGKVSDAADMQFFLDNIRLSKMQVIAKAPIDASGNFKIEIEEPLTPGIYRLRVGSQRAITYFNGTEKQVTLETEMGKIGSYDFTLENAPAANEMLKTIGQVRKKELSASDLAKIAEETEDPIAAMQYASMIPPSAENLVVMKKVAGRLDAQYPDSEYTSTFKAQVNNLESQIARRQAQEVVKVGQPAPDIALPDPEGNVMRLSDLKGKVVLLDFWASWCGPCRRANPHVVKTYNKYKDKGFTVYSVSLDRPGQAARWKQAIKQDKLTWPYHVSDLKYWNSAPAATYGVRGIPKTFLIDKDGTIASTNVSPYSLDQALEELL